MTILSDTLSFDEFVPLVAQPDPVQRFVAQLLTTAPTEEAVEPCAGGSLERITRQVWQVEQAQVLRYFTYANAPEHAACMALSSLSLILRPRLV